MTGDSHELMQAALWADRRRLKDIKSVERKIQAKREMLPQYDAYVAGVLSSGAGAQDDVLMHVMIWRFDTGDLTGGLDVADYAIRHGLKPPDRYERDTPTIVAEEVANEAERALDAPVADPAVLADALLLELTRAAQLTEGLDMHDQVRAKLYRAMGRAQQAAGQARGALRSLQRALSLHDRIGVKKDIERLEREIKKESEQPPG
jgi:hypothetical protein